MKKIAIFWKHLIIVFIISLPLITTGLMVMYFRSLNAHIPAYIFYPSVIGVPSITIWFSYYFLLRRPKISRILKDTLVLGHLRAKNKSKTNKEKISELVIDTQCYKDVHKKYTQLNYIKGLPLIIIVLTIYVSGYYVGGYDEFMNGIIFGIISFTLLTYNYFGRWVTISPKGIRAKSLFKNQFISWNQIQSIGINSTTEGSSLPDFLMLVYVSKKKIVNKHTMFGKDEKGVITFKFRSKMMHHVLAYWNGEVLNLSDVKRWRRYLTKNGIARLDNDEI